MPSPSSPSAGPQPGDSWERRGASGGGRATAPADPEQAAQHHGTVLKQGNAGRHGKEEGADAGGGSGQ